MASLGGIHVKLHEHPKVADAGLEAMGLWTVCHSYSRDKRTKGFIEDSVARRFDPELVLADRLVKARLWNRDEQRGGFVFNDWSEWNADDQPKTTAAKLVSTIVQGHPRDVMKQLSQHVSDLLIEGTEYRVVEAALRLWLTKTSAPPSWLPLLVSDVLRQNSDGELVNALRQAWKIGSPQPLARFGFVFTVPDIPREVRGDEITMFMRNAVRAWVEQIRLERGIQ